MQPETVDAVLSHIKTLWPQANDVEITLEANPSSVEAGRFTAFRNAGINRISMGVQALNDADLRKLGRLHTVSEARIAFDIARSTFERVSFDLIYARQDQSLADWRVELSEALNMSVDHLSLYQLTVEDGTAFGDRLKRGKLNGLPHEDLAADMYALTQELCTKAGLPAYEVSNHARIGSESRHNIIYWRTGDYAGIGPGAHGRLTLNGIRWATETHRAPGAWLKAVQNGSGESSRVSVSLREQAEEYAMMSLRLAEGMDVDRYEALAGRPLNRTAHNNLLDLGLIAETDGKIFATADGRAVLNGILREYLAD